MRKTGWQQKLLIALPAAVLVAVVVVVLATTLGSVPITAGESLQILWGKITGSDLSRIEPTNIAIIWQLRFPRILTAFLIGMALASSGLAFQGLLRNPLADPYIMGISAGAAVGAVLSILLHLSSYLLPVAAFVSALGAVGLVYRISKHDGALNVTIFLLTGAVLSALLGAVVSLLLVLSSEDLRQAVFWLMGSLARSNWQTLAIISPYVLLSLLALFAFSRDLNLLAFGDEKAAHLGIEVEKTKQAVIIISALMAAAAVSVSGVVGFVGLIVPHMFRLAIGTDNRLLLPVSAFGGGVFLVTADTVCRIAIPPVEIPLGAITAIIGAPLFLYLLARSSGKYIL